MLNQRKLTPQGVACRKLPLFSLALLSLSVGAQASQKPPTDDPTAPLRRFPLSIRVQRPDIGGEPVSILRINALHPKDSVFVSVDDKLKGNWTLVAATVGAGQKIHVKSWNLWEKNNTRKPIDTGPIPDADVVPLYFVVLNKHREKRVLEGIRHALETSSQEIVSQTAIFQSIYKQQNRLLNFMTAYAALGPKTCPDPKSLKNRVDEINMDLGASYDPAAQTTSPGQLQHSLDAGITVLGAFRQSPDNPAPAAVAARSQLPSVVSDWIGLVGDLMHVFIKPPHDVKLSFVPASAVETDSGNAEGVQLVTERVLETSDDSLPSMVYRPLFERQESQKLIPLTLAQNQILAGDQEISIPLGKESRDLYQRPLAWNWEWSTDGSAFSTIAGARLIPGRGLVAPISPEWWGQSQVRHVYLRSRIGFATAQTNSFEVAHVLPQKWELDPKTSPDCAAGDYSVALRMNRNGPVQPFYRFVSVALRDSAGHLIPADDAGYDGALLAKFNLSNASPGPAQVIVQQADSEKPDAPVNVFIAPKHPNVSIFCGKGDKVLRISGPEASWVKSVQIPPLFVQEIDESEAANRRLTLSGPVPASVRAIEVTYRDPQRGFEWSHLEPISVGQPRPRVVPAVIGNIPSTVAVGSGPDPTWAIATMPSGWIRSKQPVRVQMSAVQPFNWTHDVALELGFGSAGDVQTALTLPEGPNFALDGASSEAYLTLDMDTALPPNSKRNAGLLWVKLTRADLGSPWTLVTTKSESGNSPVRFVKLPTIQTVQATANSVRITLSGVEQVLGAKFPGQAAFTPLQLQDSTPGNLIGVIEGPLGATEFDLDIRDASDGVIHIKIVKAP